MNCARHLLLRRPPTAALIRPIVFPVAIPLRPASTPIPLILQTIPRLQQVVQTSQKRHNSTAIGSLTNSPAGSNSPGARKAEEVKEEVKPSYYLRFTCRPCGNRSTHNVSKQGYHYGSVLITCPGCFNRHVISDHLKVFSETSRSFDEILEQSGTGETVQRYTAAQRSYEEQLGAADTLRSRGIWSEGGNHVEVLPEDDSAGVKLTEESWQKGLDADGRNVYPYPDEEPEIEGMEVGSNKVVGGGITGGVGRKEDI